MTHDEANGEPEDGLDLEVTVRLGRPVRIHVVDLGRGRERYAVHIGTSPAPVIVVGDGDDLEDFLARCVSELREKRKTHRARRREARI